MLKCRKYEQPNLASSTFRCERVAAMTLTFVLVPGAWLGEWCWRNVVLLLRAAGYDAVPVTLPGLAERAHLLSPDTGLGTHVADLVSRLRRQNLTDIILVGHSYGGTVVTAVADRVPERVRGIVYLDASVPEDGESNNDVLGPDMAERIRDSARKAGDGWRVPPPSTADWNLPHTVRSSVEQRLTPHPLRTLEEPVRLQSSATAGLRRAFLRSSVQSPLYRRLMERAHRSGWHCEDLTGGHYPMLSVPDVVAAALIAWAGRTG
jgi:pimeloyl-ACP methyl ester carboxylesterase